MAIKHPYLWMAGVGAICAALLGHELRQRQDARSLADAAHHLLDASLGRAPELQDVDTARAIAYLDGALSLHETPERRGSWHYARALSLLQAQKPQEAAEALRRATAALGDTADTLTLRAALRLAQGDRAGAQAAVAKALTLKPHHPRAHMLAADLALDAGDGDAALTHCQDAEKRDPRAASAHNRCGLAHELLGDLHAARHEFEAAAALHPRLPHAHLNLGRLLRNAGDTEGALLAFVEAGHRAPDQFEAWLGAGLCRAALGDDVGARIDLDNARTARSDAPEPLIALADIDMRDGQRDQAITRYRAALTLDPGLSAGWVKLGNALIRTGAPADARDAFDRAIAVDDSLAAAHNGRGAALSLLGDQAAAERALTRAAALDASDPNPLLNLARLRLRAGDRPGAESAQHAAMLRDPAVAPLP